MKKNRKTTYRNMGTLAFLCLTVLVGVSCAARNEMIEKQNCMKTAIAFYKALAESTEQAQEIMGMTEFHAYGFPALIYVAFGTVEGVEQIQQDPKTYETRIKFWCHGRNASGKPVKLRRELFVQLLPDETSSTGWSVSRYRFEDKPLTLLRQILTWALWMVAAPFLFLLLLVPILGGRVAFAVAQLMGMPIQIYVSFLCFGSLGRTIAAVGAWVILISILSSQASKA